MSSAKTAIKSKAEIIEDAQRLVNKLATFDQYRRYVEQHKLALIDSRLAVFDRMLDSGEVETPRIRGSAIVLDNDLSLAAEDRLRARVVADILVASKHDCEENAVPYKSDGALGHGWACGVCGKFLQAG